MDSIEKPPCLHLAPEEKTEIRLCAVVGLSIFSPPVLYVYFLVCLNLYTMTGIKEKSDPPAF